MSHSHISNLDFFNLEVVPVYTKLRNLSLLASQESDSFLKECSTYLEAVHVFYKQLPALNQSNRSERGINLNTWDALMGVSALYLNVGVNFRIDALRKKNLPAFLLAQLSDSDLKKLRAAAVNARFGHANLLLKSLLVLGEKRLRFVVTANVFFFGITLLCKAYAFPVSLTASFLLTLLGTLGSYLVISEVNKHTYTYKILPHLHEGPQTIREVLNLSVDQFDCRFHP